MLGVTGAGAGGGSGPLLLLLLLGRHLHNALLGWHRHLTSTVLEHRLGLLT